MPFKINSTVVIFLIIGLALALLAWVETESLWFGSEAAWNRMSFGLLLFYASFALIFIALAGWLGYCSKKGFYYRNSPSTRKVVVIGISIVFGLAAWCVGIVYLSEFINKRINLSRTAETPVEIISQRESVTNTKKSSITTYIVRYTYTVDNRAYEAVSRFTKPLKGGKVKACYNPANPQSSQIRDVDFKCGQYSID